MLRLRGTVQAAASPEREDGRTESSNPPTPGNKQTNGDKNGKLHGFLSGVQVRLVSSYILTGGVTLFGYLCVPLWLSVVTGKLKETRS